MGGLTFGDLTRYRVWPDGTVQEAHEEPYHWMSDDYVMVDAVSEEDALIQSRLHED